MCVGGGVKRSLQGNYIYLGEWLGIWGHCITDNLKKLWFVTKLNQEGKLHDYKLCVAKPFKGSYHDNFGQLLLKAGINIDDIEFIEESTLVENLTVPDDSIVVKGNSRYYYTEYSSLVNEIRDRIPIVDESPEKIYFTRTGIKKKNRDFGEKQVEYAFRDMGYKIYSPELLSLDQQLVLLRNCKYFACTEGSIAHNVVFCSDNVNITIIRKVCGLISYQFTLMDIRNANATYIDSFLTLYYVFAFWSGPFLLCMRDNLINYAKNTAGIKLSPHLSKRALSGYLQSLLYKSLRGRTRPVKCNNFNFYKRLLKQLLLH